MRVYKKRKYIKRFVSHNGQHYKINLAIEKILTKAMKSLRLEKVIQDLMGVRYFCYLPDNNTNIVYIQNGNYINDTYSRTYILSNFPRDIQELVSSQLT